MCKQVRGENEALYISEKGKSCPTQILETLAENIMLKEDQFGNQ